MEKAIGASKIVKQDVIQTTALVRFDAEKLVEDWLAETRSVNTRLAYAHDLRDFCFSVFRTGNVHKALRRFFSLTEIEAGQILTKFKQLLRERGAKPATINRKLSAMRAFVDHARRRGIVNWRVTDLVKGEKERTDAAERIKMRLPAATVDGLYEALGLLFSLLPKRGLRALRDRTILALMALHGLRRVEVMRLSFSDLFEGKDGIMTIRVWGKGDKFRTIPLREDTSRLLSAYLSALKRARIEPIADACGIPVFVSVGKAKGHRLSWRQINNIVNRALSLAGLKRAGISCHSLRHAFATLAATKIPLTDLAAYLGHSSIATTGLYVHAIKSVNPSLVIRVKVF